MDILLKDMFYQLAKKRNARSQVMSEVREFLEKKRYESISEHTHHNMVSFSWKLSCTVIVLDTSPFFYMRLRKVNFTTLSYHRNGEVPTHESPMEKKIRPNKLVIFVISN